MVLFEYKTLFSFFVKDGREGQVMFRKKQKLYICKKRKIRNGYTHQGVLQGRLKLTCGTSFLCVPSMALILLVQVQPRVFTAKCSEPQVGTSNGMDGGSGVAKFSSLRTET